MLLDQKLYLGKAGDEKVYILPQMANRHGMIAGATGTGKTVTLKVLAETFSSAGVPVFLADVKGDLAGMSQAGTENEDMAERLNSFGLREDGFAFTDFPTQYWDVYGEKGLPLRTTISEMGSLLLSRILSLNDTQEGVLNAIFRIADDEGLLLIDTKDMKAMLQFVSEHASEYSLKYGNMAKQTIGAIQRGMLLLEDQGGELFFGEPAINISDWLTRDMSGKGMINILDCQKLILNPVMYSTFLLWMLSELYELLPEVGDMDRPKMVFFFDEAHLLFDSASKNLLDKVAQVVKLIRSKGVGIYFITQNPADIPGEVLSQLGNKVQHALHAYTPAEKRGLKAAADSFRENPAFSTMDELQTLGIGEALVSTLDEQGIPTVVQRVKILPPQSKMGALDDEVRSSRIKESLLYTKYAEGFDRDSAYEFLERMHIQLEEEAERARLEAEEEKRRAKEEAERAKQEAAEARAAEKERLKAEAAELKAAEKAEREAKAAAEKAVKAAIREQEKKEKQRKAAISSVVGSATGTIGRQIGRQMGGAVGGSFGKTLGGNVGASLGRGLLQTLLKK